MCKSKIGVLDEIRTSNVNSQQERQQQVWETVLHLRFSHSKVYVVLQCLEECAMRHRPVFVCDLAYF